MAEADQSSAPLMLSVSGARGIVGATMTPDVARTFAGAFGSHIRGSGVLAPTLCVGRDSRPSGPELMQAAMEGLNGVGCRVIDLGVVATPTVGVMIRHHDADGGLVITASHNPTPWNGIKCLNADGVAPPPEIAAEVIRRFETEAIDRVLEGAEGDVVEEENATWTHVERVLARVETESIRAAEFKVVIDSVNGAGCGGGAMLLKALGCAFVHLNGEPTGEFAHTPEPLAENLVELAGATKAENAAIGFAQDPDADRLAIIDESGRYIGEEYTLVLAAKRMLDRRAASGDSGEVFVAANLSTSRMIDDLAACYEDVTVLRTAVGEANVVAALKKKGAAALIGGEGNGGVILPGVCWVRDSLSAMALVLGLMADERRPLSAIVDDLPRYVMIKRKADLTDVGGLDAVAGMIEKVRAHFAADRIDEADGIRIDRPEGWVHLRPSNTEPIVRLIAEGTDEATANALIDETAGVAGLG